MQIFNKIVFFVLKIQTIILLRLKKPIVVAITGSVGKTSTKVAIAKTLSESFSVQYSEKSYNSQTGLPLSVFGLSAPNNPKNPFAWLSIFVRAAVRTLTFNSEVLVLEMGADRVGEIKYLTDFVKPDIGVVIAAHKVHTELFKTLDAIFKEKSQLAFGAKQAIINVDEQNLREDLLPQLDNPITYGSKDADFVVDNLSRNKNGTIIFDLTISAKTQKIKSKMISSEAALSLACAAACANALKMSSSSIKLALEKIQPTPGRMNPLSGKNGALIVDDSYNASPKAVIAAIKNVRAMKPKRKIYVLGNMNELGDYEQQAHEEVGQAAADADLLVTVGESAKKYLAQAANNAGLKKDNIKSFNSPIDAGNWLAPQLKSGDVVLVKGSQNKVFLEEAIKIMLKNASDKNQLTRQDDLYMRVKCRQFQI